jgi:mxaJ protein
MRSLAALLAALSLATPSPGAPPRAMLTVCADPNNMPFSNQAQQGFENRIAALIARDLGVDITYVWWAQRRGYVRNTLGSDACDLWPGVAKGVDMVTTTLPYYRSTYVFVTRADRPLAGLAFDDPRLKSLRIGVQMVGNDAMNTPPTHALAMRGITDNVRGYMLYGNYAEPNPPAKIIDGVARGDIDVAIAWGPMAGYFAKTSPVKLRVEPVSPPIEDGQWPMTFAIAMGVRKGETRLKARIDQILQAEQPAIRQILADYAIPTIAEQPPERSSVQR